MSKEDSSIPTSEDGQSKSLGLHIAEYQALTKSSWLGSILNFLFIFQWLKTIEVRKIRLAFSSSALSSGCDFAGVSFPYH
jgi:hypothetical protein